ncbi:HlyD family type I secretion periplasmic adaptor subunit [Chitinilyticum litopenaei]|uniref:HlyD family type I secretion periplasmic adaptor subunit n=1 Tax=Chitinilyticum litopenaei TaxID=1121276 RepID=UPI0003FE7A87|nr:HlyD family type I secretion periplasmic adaptor subunit [Chitinilyticum litopenaei]
MRLIPEKYAGLFSRDVGHMGERTAAMFLPPLHLPLLLLRACALFLLCALIWAYFAEIDEITVGEGRVIPSSQVQQIQNLEGGIVASIPVRVGEIVRKNQVLMTLDEKRFSSSLGESRVKNAALSAKIARLKAEANGSEFVPGAEQMAENAAIYQEELLLFRTRQRDLETTLSVLRQQEAQRAQEISEKRALLSQLTSSQNLLNQELKLTKPMVEQRLAAEVELLRLERQAADLQGQIDAARLAIPRLQIAQEEARSKISGAHAKYRSDAATELSAATAEWSALNAGKVALEDRLERTTLRSPVTGIVKNIAVNTVGGVIQPGITVMEIVPMEDNLLIEAKIRPADIGFLRPGQSVSVKLSAYDYSIYGDLEATLENITADSFTKEKEESFYLVQVRTRKNHLGSADKPLPIIPGMLATVHIRTGKKTILEYLLKPIVKARTEAMRER